MKLRRLASSYAKRFGDLLKYDVEEELARFTGYRSELAKYTVDAVAFMKQAQDRDMKILIEGANALMLDIDYGTVSRPEMNRQKHFLSGDRLSGLAVLQP
jgi:adenylosuccinate synthase